MAAKAALSRSLVVEAIIGRSRSVAFRDPVRNL
jgi:hypothetical protein